MEINTISELFDCFNYSQVKVINLNYTILYTGEIHSLIIKCSNLNKIHLTVSNNYNFEDYLFLNKLTDIKIILLTGNDFSGYSYISPFIISSKEQFIFYDPIIEQELNYCQFKRDGQDFMAN